MVNEAIKKLVCYGLERNLLKEEDVVFATNQLLEALQIEEYEDPGTEFENVDLEPVLEELLDYAYEHGVLEENGVVYRDLLDTKLMSKLMPRPSEVIAKFWEVYRQEGPKAATDYYYQLSQDSDYIRRYRIAKDVKWKAKTPYGEMDITINLSKPEKDPKAIAAAKNAKQGGYPKCLLCMENEGYAGRINHPARQNHRIIPVTIQVCKWG